MDIYHIGPGGHLDLTDEVESDLAPIPRGWTRLAPPSLDSGEYAVWVAPPPGTELEPEPEPEPATP